MATNNPLTEIIPDAYRKYVYVVAAAAVFLYGLWEASQGDWAVFVLALLGSLVPSMAASNTSSSAEPEYDDEFDEGHFYDGHEGV